MSIATNNWVIENPEWQSQSYKNRSLRWFGIYGSNYFLKYRNSYRNTDEDRYFFKCLETAEHFYILYWTSVNNDIIFGSYLLSEVERFISKLSWGNKDRVLYVRDVVDGKCYNIICGDDSISFVENPERKDDYHNLKNFKKEITNETRKFV